MSSPNVNEYIKNINIKNIWPQQMSSPINFHFFKKCKILFKKTIGDDNVVAEVVAKCKKMGRIWLFFGFPPGFFRANFCKQNLFKTCFVASKQHLQQQ